MVAKINQKKNIERLKTQCSIKKIFMIAGEASGDLHAAAVINQLKKIFPSSVEVSGIGGKLMKAAGMDVFIDAKDLAVMGLFEITAHLTVIYKALQQVKHYLQQQKPDLVILVDYGGFNLRVAKLAKLSNIPVLYFISPKIWAWHSSRVYKIARVVDKMAVILPFEVEFYRKFVTLDVRYVGNPLVESVKPILSRAQAYKYFAIDPNKRTIGLLPGSRKMEINRLLPVMLETAKLLINYYPDAQFILPIASTISPALIDSYVKQYRLNIRIIAKHHYSALQLCEAMAVASGTATLEAMLLQIPIVIIYKIFSLTYLFRPLLKTKYIGLGNIIANDEIAKEFLQKAANPQLISQEICRLIEDVNYRRQILKKLAQLKELVGEEGAAKKVAEIAREMLEKAENT